MSETDFGRTPGALCPLHPGEVATRTCVRCGNFMCDACSEGGTQARCPTCRERAGAEGAFALNRANWTVSALWDACWAAFQREWGMLSVATLIYFGVSMGAQVIVNLLIGMGGAANSPALAGVLGGVGFVGQSVLQGLVQLGLLTVCFDVLNGRAVDLARLFSQMHKAVPYVVTMLVVIFVVAVPVLVVVGGAAALVGLATGGLDALRGSANYETVLASLFPMMAVAGLLLVIPGTYFLLPLYLVQPELAYRDTPPGPMDVLRRCWGYARGERLSIVGVGLLTGVVGLAGFLACCVGFIPAMGLAQLLIAGLYLALSRGPDEVG